MSFPNALYKEGYGIEAPVVYAYGRLIVCSTQPLIFNDWKKLLQSSKVKRIAIANPAIAPYGKAAVQALQKEGVWTSVKPKIVYGESIAQVNTYIMMATAEVGFTTQSLLKEAGSKQKLYWKLVAPSAYTPIEQGMLLIKNAKTKDYSKTEKFYQYLQSKEAKAIFKQYGYQVK
jgi:molybdate transport system substrate-binding protein